MPVHNLAGQGIIVDNYYEDLKNISICAHKPVLQKEEKKNRGELRLASYSNN